jgi:hypothetical protein
MVELCVLFLHHASDDTTRHNLATIRHHNPDAIVVPIHCRDGRPCDPVPGSVEVPLTFGRGRNWENADLVYLEWFRSSSRVDAAHYVFFEWDTHCTTSVREHYADVWDADVVGVTTPLHRRDQWGWFKGVQFLPREWQPHAAAIAPLCGWMLSRRAIEALAAEPVVEGVFCELRAGTLCHWCGFELVPLPKSKNETMICIPKDESRWINPARPAIYHPVRTLTPAQLSSPPSSAAVVVLPYYGEFGWMVARHVRWVHQLEVAHKVVACRRGEEPLYPTADEFFYDWPEALPDWQRQEDGHGDDTEVRAMARERYPHHLLIRPHYPNPWAWDHAASVKFRPSVRAQLPAVDVALCPRRRDHGTEKNWPHWTAVASAIRAAGFTVGLVGQEATSYTETPSDTRAWNHTDGATAGTIDLLNHCRVYLGGDTGVSHLAALADVPTILFAPPHHLHGWTFIDFMKRATTAPFEVLPGSAWSDPALVIDATLKVCKRNQHVNL